MDTGYFVRGSLRSVLRFKLNGGGEIRRADQRSTSSVERSKAITITVFLLTTRTVYLLRRSRVDQEGSDFSAFARRRRHSRKYDPQWAWCGSSSSAAVRPRSRILQASCGRRAALSFENSTFRHERMPAPPRTATIRAMEAVDWTTLSDQNLLERHSNEGMKEGGGMKSRYLPRLALAARYSSNGR